MAVPKGAKRVFKGILYDTWQWQQEMFDGSFKTFEAVTHTPSVQVIAVQGDKVLVAHEEQPHRPKFYGLFGGRCEEGETILESGKREFLEETGMVSSDWALIKEYRASGSRAWSFNVYAAKNCRKIQEPNLEAGEKIKVLRVSFEKFLELVASPKFRNVEFANDLFRIRSNPKKLQEFKKKLFS